MLVTSSKAMLAIIAIAYMIPLAGCTEKQMPQPKGTGKAVKHSKLREYIQDEYIAEVISNSVNPRLYAAVAKVEADYRPQIIGKAGEKGMFQILEKFHGKVPDDLTGQLRKAESILEPLIKKHGLRKGISRYNGKGRKAQLYAAKILKTMQEIPI